MLRDYNVLSFCLLPSALCLASTTTINANLLTQGKISNMTACTPSIEPAIIVTVFDARQGVPLKADILVKDGNFQEKLNLQGVTAAGQVIYGGAFERPGVYTVRISKDGYETSVVEEIKVAKNECHVVTRKLRVDLKPISSR
jgi:hypothetical protein